MTQRLSRVKSLALAGAMAAVVVVGVVALGHRPYALTLAWGALLLASFVGWGSVVNRWLAPDHWSDWGLRAGWGMGLTVLTGGYLCVLHLAVRSVLVAQVALGCALFIGTLWIRRWPRLSVRRAIALTGSAGTLLMVLGAYGLAVLTYFGYLGDRQFQPSDDQPLYFVFAEKLVQAGSMLEPFAVRRATTFGGQVYLHALFISVAPVCYVHVVDAGISLVMVTALLVGSVSRSGLKTKHAASLGLALLLLFTLQDVRVNTGSLLSGLAAILTLYRTLRAPFGPEPDRPAWPMNRRRIVALAALTVVCILLRTSNAAAVLPFIVLVFASDFVLGSRRPMSWTQLGSLAASACLFAAAFLLSLLPWSVLLDESVGSYFFPLGHHNLTPGWTFLERSKTWDETASNVVDRIVWDRPLSFIPFAIAGLIPLAGRARNDLVALTLGSFIGVFSLARDAVSIGAQDTARFSFAYFATMALLAAISVRRVDARGALVAAAIGMHLSSSKDSLHKQLLEVIHGTHKAFAQRQDDALLFDATIGDYRDVQSRIPAGTTVVTAVNEGWQFDFKRNEIWALDALAAMGPAPGWPAYRGPDALGDYLRASGVQYLIWVDFNLAGELYNRAHRQSFFAGNDYLREEGRLELDAMDSIEGLTAKRRVIYRANGMTVVDLTRPAGR